MIFLLCLALTGFAAASSHSALPSRTTAQLDRNTVLVLFGTRHGNRNPEKLVQSVAGVIGKEGDLELTSIGKRQAYGLGKEIRAFVKTFIDQNYLPSQAKFYSSSANRCQATLQAVLAGLFDPSDWADWNKSMLDHWSPVPYTTDDQLLRMYSVKGCTNSDEAWKPISTDTLPDLLALKMKNKQLLEYMQKMDGRDATIGNAGDIADNIINMDFYNAKYPDWLAKPRLGNYTKESIRAAFLAFAENHMNRCAAYKPCRDMMGGMWADHILQALDAAAAGKSGPKLIGYASHTEVTLSVMILLGIDKEELTTSAGFVVELRKDKTGPSVRLLQHDPNPIDQHVIYPATLVRELSRKANSEGWMPLQDFKQYASRSAFSDWKTACGIKA